MQPLTDFQFKGRYGGIAKLYGSNATYDAIKSFFAKEITRTADQLLVQVPDYRVERNARACRQTVSSAHRQPHVCLDDDEIIVVSENGSRMDVRHPTRPSEQVSTPLLVTGVMPSKRCADYTKVLSTAAVKRPDNPEVQAQRATRCTEANPFRLSVPASTRESVFDSGRQELIVDQMVSHERQQKISRKRPYSATQEELDDQLDRTSHANSSLPHSTISFGYVSNQGDYCCALCMTRLSSEHTLAQHESKSQLHLANLKNLTVVSRGRAFLAQITSLSPRSSHAPTARHTTTMKLGGFDRHDVPATAGCRSSMDPLQESIVHESCRTNEHHDSGDDTILIDPRSSTIGPQTESQDYRPNKRISSLEITEALRPDKGKGPALDNPTERHLAAAPRRPPTSTLESHQQIHEQPQATAIAHAPMTSTTDRPAKRPSPHPQRGDITPAPDQRRNHPQSHPCHAQPPGHQFREPISPDSKRLIQTFLSAGMTLAKKYVDDHHPELVPHLHQLVHDSIDFPTLSAVAAGGDGEAQTERHVGEVG